MCRYVRSEGIAAVVLKRSDLLDVPRWAAVNPYCTVLNCGINNDGFTKEGITFPSKNAQLALEKQASFPTSKPTASACARSSFSVLLVGGGILP